MSNEADLTKTRELLSYLEVDMGLDRGQAWTVIWYLGNLYWMVPERFVTSAQRAHREEIRELLTGIVPDGYTIEKSQMPQMSQRQAIDTIRHLGTLRWQVTDVIEMCEVCRDLYDTESEGYLFDDAGQEVDGNFCDADCWAER